MRSWFVLAITIVGLGLAGCNREENNDDSAARKAGRAAHEIANKTEDAAKKAERKLEQAAKEAREGWKEADHEDRSKTKK